MFRALCQIICYKKLLQFFPNKATKKLPILIQPWSSYQLDEAKSILLTGIKDSKYVFRQELTPLAHSFMLMTEYVRDEKVNTIYQITDGFNNMSSQSDFFTFYTKFNYLFV